MKQSVPICMEHQIPSNIYFYIDIDVNSRISVFKIPFDELPLPTTPSTKMACAGQLYKIIDQTIKF